MGRYWDQGCEHSPRNDRSNDWHTRRLLRARPVQQQWLPATAVPQAPRCRNDPPTLATSLPILLPRHAQMALLPRVKAAVAVGAAAVLMGSAAPALAADLVLGQQTFDNNCGERRRRSVGGEAPRAPLQGCSRRFRPWAAVDPASSPP